MPAVSKAQQTAAQIAEHHPEEAKGAAGEMAESMTREQLHDFASGKKEGKPEHVKKEASQAYVEGYFAGYMHKRAQVAAATTMYDTDVTPPETEDMPTVKERKKQEASKLRLEQSREEGEAMKPDTRQG